MPEADIHVTITLPNTDGLPVDEFETSFNYSCAAGVDSAGVTTAIEAFYNTIASHQALAAYINGSVDRSGLCKIEYYDVTAHLDGSPHGAPFQTDTFSLGAQEASTKNLPNQLCATISYYSELDSEGTTVSRHRGRMYFGPLCDGIASLSVPNPRLTSNFLDDATGAFQNLTTTLAGLANPKIVSVWSRVHSAFEPAVGVFVENRFDTQRRRAVAATTREVRSPL